MKKMGGEEMSSGGGNMEKILVSIRVRPLNDKELTRNDVCDWDCINNNTIVCKHNLPERSLYPSAYTFDRVFGFDCPTKQVYEEGAKEVALCVLNGINASIFAYGQTSSGKTYTMCGITEFAVNDIFDYIDKHNKREFTLRFSALEIYNEAVRDLLSGDNTPLRLLDDPERGTVVEKLTEETLRDRSHLEELLSICETQRRIGETSLNETSSRSHQILRLTIESSGREYSGDSSSTLAASVSFVDLAGSERASQTLAAGTRLKEGSHINRSLLTLGTVIRKLSKGRSGHVPYRDSKLTRILQNSLGGNARTAIICTMSPARSHVEQSRNTLLFASCAKEVSTNAQVNLVVSEKALVKQLQRELARMEKELKNLGSGSTNSDVSFLLKQKEELIEKMEKQIKELTWQRDLAQSRVENFLKSVAEERSSKMDDYSVTSSLDIGNPHLLEADIRRRSNGSSDFGEPSTMLYNSGKSNCLDLLENCEEDDFLLDDSTPQFAGPDLCKGWEEIANRTNQEQEDACKEVRCIEMEGKEISRQAEKEEIQEPLDVVIDKKAVSEVLSPRNEESLSTTRSLECEDNEKSFPTDEKCAENEDMKLSPFSKCEDGELPLNKGDADTRPYIKHEGDEQPLKNLDMELCPSEEIEETEQALEKENKNSSSFVEQIEQSSMNEDGKMSLSPVQTEHHPKKEDRELSSSPKQKKQSAEKGGRELTQVAKLDDDDASKQNRDKELGQGADKELDETPFTKGDREATSTDDIDIATYEALKEKVKKMQKMIEYLTSMLAAEQWQSPSFETNNLNPGNLKLKRSRSCKENLMIVRTLLWHEEAGINDNAPTSMSARHLSGRSWGSSWRLSGLKDAASIGKHPSKNSNNSIISFDAESTLSSTSNDAHSTKDSDAENGNSFHEFIAGLKEMASQHQSIDATNELDNEFAHDAHDFFTRKNETKKIKLENPHNRNVENTNATHGQSAGEDEDDSAEDTNLEKVQKAKEPYSSGPSDFERQQQQIIELWKACNVPLIHRTYFFLLFKGDPSDFVYMEVEFRRLSFLKESMSHGSNASRRQSVKALTREKEWLARQIPKKFSKNKRDKLYQKWGIGLNTKQRSLQLAHNLWTNTQDKEHIKESASLVAKLVGFEEPSETPKEMFGLSLSPISVNQKSSGWRLSKSLSGISLIG